MQLLDANELLVKARDLLDSETCDFKDIAKAEGILNEILNHNIGNELVLFTIGSSFLKKGWSGLAVQILSQVTSMSPGFAEAWNNLSLAWRDCGDWDRAEICCRQAFKLKKEPDLASNLAGLTITRGTPERALEYCEEGLALDPTHQKLIWHKGLASLELRKWEDGWDCHEARLTGGADTVNIAKRNYHGDEPTPMWDGKSKGRVVIHGEQGMGDEIMFASCLPDAIATGADILFEPSPRLEGVFQRSFPEIKVFGTNKVHGEGWIEEEGPPDFMIPIGSLPKFYRRAADKFPGTPYLKTDPSLKEWWLEKLMSLPKKPNIGIAWQGGVEGTRYDVRSFHPRQYAPLFDAIDANWISLQYDKTAQLCVNDLEQELGVTMHHWPKAVSARDESTGEMQGFDDLVALISNLDLVISVCQTAIHVAGALNVPCLCLTPSQPSWRYGAVKSETMPWYDSVRLLRQAPETNDWAPVVERATRTARGYLNVREEVEA